MHTSLPMIFSKIKRKIGHQWSSDLPHFWVHIGYPYESNSSGCRVGRSLLTNHRMPYCINDCTTKKRHDLLQSIPVHHYSQKNGLAIFKKERVMKFKDPGSSAKDLLMTESPSWEPHTTVSELIDSLMAWQSLDHIIHPTHYGTDVIVWIVKKVTNN